MPDYHTMSELEIIEFDIENFKKQMAVLFVVADEDLKNQLLDELNELLKRRDKLIDKKAEDE